MKFKSFAAAAAFASLVVTAPALAQDVQLTAGATVYGVNGNVIGTIEKVEGGNAVINTGTVSAALPANTFGQGEKGPTLGWTKEQFEEAIGAAGEKSAAALDAALVTGADLYSSDGVMLGKVTSVSADGAIEVELPAGAFTLQKNQVGLQGDKLTVAATKADIEAAVGGQAGA